MDDRREPAVVDPAHAAETTTGVSVARTSAWNLVATVVPQAFLIALSIAAARFLGPDLFGRQSFIAFVELSLVMFFVTGLASSLARFVGASLGAGQPGHVRALERAAVRVSWVAAAVAAAVLILIAVFGSGPRAAWLFAAVFAVASILQRERNAVLSGFQRWREVTIAGLLIGAVGTAVVIGVLALGGGISGIFAVEAGTGVALLAWTAVLARRALSSLGSTPADGAPTRRMLRFAAYATFGVVLTLIVWRRSEFLFLNHYSTDAEIGFYSIAFAAASAVVLAPLAVTGVLLPSLATLHGARDAGRIRSGYVRAARLLLMLSLPLIAAGMALGPTLIEVVYGEAYSDAGLLLIILLVPAPLVVLANLSAVLLAATQRIVFPAVVGTLAALLNIGLSFVLIPRYDSLGAAIANAIVQVVASIPAIVYVQRLVGGGVDWKPLSLAKAAVSATIGGLVAWGCVTFLGDVLGILVGLAAGAGTFLGVARLLGMLSADDALWLERAFGSAFGGQLAKATRFFGARPSRDL